MNTALSKTNPLIYIILAGALILPVVPTVGLDLRVSSLVVLIMMPIFILDLQKIKNNKFLKIYFILWLFMLFSTFWGYLFLNVPFTIRDFNEMVKIFIPFLILWFVAYIPFESLQKTIKIFFVTTAPILIIFSFIQFYYSNLLTAKLLKLYGGASHIELIMTRTRPRIIATGTDPNIGAAIILLFLFFFMATILNKKSILAIIYSFFLLMSLSFTASRTAIVAGLFTFFLFIVFSIKINFGYKIFLILLFILFSAYVWINVPYVRLGFLMMFEGTNNSVLTRLEKFGEAVNLFKQSPLFGWGPAKAIHTTVVDGEYFLLLRRYGIVGVSIFLFFLLKSIFFAKKILKFLNLNKDEVIIVSTFLCFAVSMLIIMLTNNFLSGYQLAYPFFVLLGYVYKVKMNHSLN